MSYAETTSVPVERSRAEIEKILTKYGASKFASFRDADRSMVGFEAKGRVIRFILPAPDPNEERFTHKPTRGLPIKRTAEDHQKQVDQEIRRRWRALSLVIKAKLEAVDSGIETFDEAFMANIVLPGGETAGEQILPQIVRAIESNAKVMPKLLLMPGRP